MLPTAADLDDPDGFVHREQLDFSEIDKMLGEAAEKHGRTEQPTSEDEADEDGDARSEPARRRGPRPEGLRGPARSCATSTWSTWPPTRTGSTSPAGPGTSPAARW